MDGSRIFNSTSPFGESAVGYSYPRKELESQGKEGKEVWLHNINTLLRGLLTQGTAKCMGAKNLSVEDHFSIIAQAESEGLQEFSPTSTEHTFIRSHCNNKNRPSLEQSTACNNVARPANQPESRLGHAGPRPPRSPRKRRKRQRDKERWGQRTPYRVPEQESSSSLSHMQTQEETLNYINGSYSYASRQSLGVQETEWPGPGKESCAFGFPSMEAKHRAIIDLTNPFHCSQEGESDSPVSSLVECEVALKALEGTVTQEDRCFVEPFFRKVEREAAEDKWHRSDVNEGILFHPEEKLQPNDFEYREGRDYTVLGHIRNGSFGDVFSVQDNITGYKCAIKKIPLNHFNSEEVGSWSALNSPRIVEFFGAVCEGLNVILFMDLKPGSLGQLLKERGRLPEDLALHYFCQVLGALEHLRRRRVLHRDVKVDNILLSEDGKETFLCDFGHSERLDSNGRSTKAYRGASFHGTETHMAPEVVKGESCCAKADIWSCCCMLLHMLNGCLPWIRYFSLPLFVKIANEPPPLKEIPPHCNVHTVNVFNAGLQKEPIKRASAKELMEKAKEALKEVGGLTSPVKGAYQEPETIAPQDKTMMSSSTSIPFSMTISIPMPSIELSSTQMLEWVSPWRENAQKDDEEEEAGNAGDEDEREFFSSKFNLLPACQSQPQTWEHANSTSTVSEQELQKLSRDLILGRLSQPHPPEQLLSILSSDCSYQRDPGDKDSGRWSVSMCDDLSSSVISSYNSQTDGDSFNADWLGPPHQPSPSCLEGVDVWIEDFNGHCLRIRESPKVTVGHIAIGISEQILEKTFSMETLDGQGVTPTEEVPDSGLWLRCISAPDKSRNWSWRVRDGELEMLE